MSIQCTNRLQSSAQRYCLCKVAVGRSLTLVAALILVLVMLPAPSRAADAAEVGASVGLATVTVASAAGGPVVLAVGPLEFVAAYGIGWLLAAVPPPDHENYAVVATPPSLLNPPVVYDPSASLVLNQAKVDLLNKVTTVTDYLLAARITQGRLAGASLFGTPADVAMQAAALHGYEAQVNENMFQAASLMNTYRTLLAAEFPSLEGMLISPAQLIATRDLEAQGIFPSADQAVLDSWMLGANEVSAITGTFSRMTDIQINTHAPLTFGEGMELVADYWATRPFVVPEPSALMLLGIGTLFGYQRRRKGVVQ